MANTFFSRLQLKYDTLANWNTNKDVVLLKGEIGICEVPINSDPAVQGDLSRPQILFKVGDGVSKWENLPWASAKAADVYAWAKQADLPVGPVENDKGGNVISGISWDRANNRLVYTTDTVATSKGLEELTNKVKNIEDNYATNNELATAIGTINGAIALKADKSYVDAELEKKTNQSDFDALKSKVEDEDGALAKANENATAIANVINGTTPVAKATDSVKLDGKAASDYALKTDAQGYANAVLGSSADDSGSATVYGALKAASAVLGSDADTSGSYTVYGAVKAANKVQSELNAFLTGANDTTEVIDTLKEIQEFMTDDTGAFVALSKKVTDIENGDTAVVAKNLNEAGKAVVKGVKVDNATNADSANDLTDNAKEVVKGIKVDNAGHADTATNATQLNGQAPSAYLLKSDAPGYADILTKTEAGTTYEPIGAESRAKAYADGLAGNYATSAQGALADSAVQPEDLHAIATSGSINDLVANTKTTYIIFNCGSSSEVI